MTTKSVKRRLAKEADKLKAKASSTLEFCQMIIENAYTFHGINIIPLLRTGLVLVTGENRDTATVSSNGSGKSRMWDCLLRLLYGRKAMDGESPLAAYDKEKGNFRIEAEFNKSGHNYVYREVRNHDEFGTGLFLLRDGKPHGPVNDPEALRKFVIEIINRTYEEFIGTVIWRQNHDHVLIDGTPSERVKWISDFFGLSTYDELHSRFRDQHKSVRDAIAGMADLRAEYKLVREQMSKFPNMEKARKQRKRIRRELESCREEAARSDKLLSKLTHNIDRLRMLDGAEAELSSAGASKKSSTELLAKARKKQARLQELHAYMRRRHKFEGDIQERQQKHDTAKAKAVSKAHDLWGTIEWKPKVLRARAEADEAKARKAITDLRLRLSNVGTLEEIREMVAELRTLGFDPRKANAKDMRDEITGLEEKLEVLSDVITLSRQIMRRHDLTHAKSAECPTCGSIVDRKKLKAEIDKAVIALEKAHNRSEKHRERIKELRSGIDALRGIESGKRKLYVSESDDFDIDDVKSADTGDVMRRKLEKAQTIITDTGIFMGFLSRYEAARSHLRDRESDAGPDDNTDFTKEELSRSSKEIDTALYNVEEDVRSLTEAQAREKNVLTLRAQLEKAGIQIPDSIPDALKVMSRKLHDAEDACADATKTRSKLRDELEEVEVGIKNFDVVAKRVQDMAPKIDRLLKLERKERILKALVKAYSPTGLKVKRLRYLLGEIRKQLPVWTSILFTEKNFTIDVTGNEKKIGFEITQKRKGVPKKKPSGTGKRAKKITESGSGKSYTIKYDAKYASGSERTRISMCLLLTLGDVASSAKSCNLQVLDELERGVDTQSKRLIAEEIVTLMRNSKPSLYLITHSLDISPDQCDAKLMVVKEHQRTTTHFKQLRRSRSQQEEPTKKTKSKNRSNR